MFVEEIFNGWFPDFLGETRRVQKDQREVFIVPITSLFHGAPFMMHKVALDCDVIRVRWSRRADDGLHEHR